MTAGVGSRYVRHYHYHRGLLVTCGSRSPVVRLDHTDILHRSFCCTTPTRFTLPVPHTTHCLFSGYGLHPTFPTCQRYHTLPHVYVGCLLHHVILILFTTFFACLLTVIAVGPFPPVTFQFITATPVDWIGIVL